MRRSRQAPLALRAGAIIAALLLLVALPVAGDAYLVYLISLAMCYALAAVGLNMLMGYGSDISLGHAGFFAVGAYTTALGMSELQLPLAASLPLAGVFGAVLGGVLALPALRLRGLYLVIATLAFGLIVERIIGAAEGLTGGFNGLAVVTSVGGTVLFYIILSVFVVLIAIYRNLLLGGFADVLQSIRDHEIAAKAMGVNVVRVKIKVFAVAGAYAAIGGGLYAVLVSYIVGESFTLRLSLVFVAMVVLGGGGSIYGPVLGAVLLTGLPQLLADYNFGQDYIFAAAIIGVLLFFPHGLVGVGRGIAGAAARFRAGGPRTRAGTRGGNAPEDLETAPATVGRGVRPRGRGLRDKARKHVPRKDPHR